MKGGGPITSTPEVANGAADAASVLTFLIVDIRGYTRFTVEQGDGAGARLADRFADLTDEVVRSHRGEVIELRGDEALAVFPSARQALRSAVALQQRFEREARADLPLLAGIGLDAGEALPVRGGFRGAAVNLAARLCSLAGPGEILASETVVNLARKLEGVEYLERGYAELKGFTGPIKIVSVTASESGIDRSLTAQPTGGDSQPGLLPSTQDRPNPLQNLPIGGFLGALADGKLVARERERRQLEANVDAVVAGQGRLVLIIGEPGVGKTRLAQEATLVVRNRGFVVMTGRCYEPYGAVPFYPFREAIGQTVEASTSGMRAQLLGRWPHLAHLLSDASVPRPSPAASNHEEQQRLFWSVTNYLQTTSAAAPVALLLDDLQWADGSSLDLLQYLAPLMRAFRVLLVATCRDTALGRRSPLQRTILDLERERLLERVPLERMDRAGTADLMSETIGTEGISAGLAELIHRRTEGNPFFTQEIFRTLVDRGDIYREGDLWLSRPGAEIDVPETVRAAIDQRLSVLSEQAQDALHTAAILGQNFEFDDLQSVLGIPEEEVERCLEEAVGAGIVQAGRGDEYAFKHALTQQALYARVSPHRRRRIHLAAGRALEALPQPMRERRATELARHFLEGGDAERGFPYAVLAGDAAEAVFAHADAAVHYETALALAQRLGDNVRLAGVREKLGALLTATIRYTEALAMLEEAAGAYRAVADRESEGRVVAQIGRVHVVNGTVHDGLTRLTAFRDGLEESRSFRALANLRASLAHLFFALGRYEEARTAAGEAVEIAQQAGDTRVQAEAEARRGAAIAMLGHWTDAADSLVAALALADRAPDLFTRCRSLQALAGIALMRGDLAESGNGLSAALAAAETMGNRRQTAVSNFGLSLRALVAGDSDESSLRAEQALSIMRSLEGSWATACQLPGLDGLCLPEERWGGAGQYLLECLSMSARGGLWSGVIRVNSLIWDGSGEAALVHLAGLPALAYDGRQAESLHPLRAWADILAGNLNEAAVLVSTELQDARGADLQLWLVTWLRLAGMLADRQDRWEDAVAHFDEATNLARRISYPRARANTLAAWGRFESRRGLPEAAHHRLTEALAVYRTLSATEDVQAMQRDLDTLGSH